MLLAFNKPYGVLSQFNQNPGEEGTQRTLAEFRFPDNVMPLGRLDLDSEGLLLLTDEPALERELLHPTKAHKREYHALVDGQPDPSALQTLESGTLVIRGHQCLPATASIIPEPETLTPRVPPLTLTSHPVTSWLSLVLHEGKNRQVRRMTAAVGHPTLRLIRHRIGKLTLDDLALSAGEFRSLTEPERALLFD